MNTLFGEVTVRKTGYQTKSVKGATGYTMPNRPQQAFSTINAQEKQISNQIMFIPFPEIRNIIITFLKPYPQIPRDQSEILLAEYQQNKELNHIDMQITQKIKIGYHQKSKLQKLQRCFDKANKLKQTINSIKQKIRNAQKKDVTQVIQQINSEARTQKNRVTEPQKKQEIEQTANQQIINQLVIHQKIYSQLNEHHINLDSTFAEVKQFCQEMQKILPIIWRVEGVPETREEMGAKNFIEYFQTEIKNLLDSLSEFIHEGEAWLELFRNKVKSRSWTGEEDTLSEVKQYEDKLKTFIEQYSAIQLSAKKLYQKLRQVSKLQQHIIPNLASETSQNMKQYESFVETFTDIKEISNAKNQREEFERIISDEERYLSDHMKTNCGLIVYYKPSQMYEQFAAAVVNRTYVEQIFSKRLAPIRSAIKYINDQYGGFYKRACEDNYSRSKLKKHEVRKVLEKFMEERESLEGLQRYKRNNNVNEKVHFEYVIHLIESLNRLMSLASQ